MQDPAANRPPGGMSLDEIIAKLEDALVHQDATGLAEDDKIELPREHVLELLRVARRLQHHQTTAPRSAGTPGADAPQRQLG